MERQVKIVCTVTNDLNFDQRMNRICSSLVKAGYDVTLIGRKLPHSIPLKKQVFKQKRLFCFFQSGKLFYLEYNIRLFWYLMWTKFDLVCGIDLDTLVPAYLTSVLKRKVCVYDAHEYFSEVPEVINRPLTKKVWEGIAALIIPRLKYCYTVGAQLSGVFQQRYGTPFAVIRNMPVSQHNDIQVSVSDPGKEKILFYQGAINMGRGLEALVAAMAQLENYRLWIAGDGDIRSVLEQQVAESGYQDRIVFLGRVSPDKLREMTPKAWLGLNLLENKGLNYYYSLANKYFDYVQAGVPVLQMQFPEYIHLNQQFRTAILIESLQADTIASAVLALEKDQNLYEVLKSNCLEASKIWNWEHEESCLIDFYRKIN
jgi:glycosyltransferase involved in cell wall biosynthesis